MRIRPENKIWLLVGLWGTYNLLVGGVPAWGQQPVPYDTVPATQPAIQPAVESATEPVAKPDPFIRILRDEDGNATALQTATAHYVSEGAGGATVDLIGAVHIGDKEYYEALNKQFTEYEVLLYELVAERGTRVPKGGGERNGNPLMMVHSMAQSVLGLESQMEHVDYTKDNFVHADMTPGEMAAAMKERGDTPLTFALSAFTEAMREQNRRALAAEKEGAPADPLAEVDILSMLTDKNAGSKLKVTMAEQFGATGSLDSALGSTMNQAILLATKR